MKRLAPLLVLVPTLAFAQAPQPAQKKDPFVNAVDALVKELEEAAADSKVKVEVSEIGSKALGWAGAGGKDVAARHVVLWTPSGVNQAFGLLPVQDYVAVDPLPERAWPVVLSARPGLVVVQGIAEQVALDQESSARGHAVLSKLSAALRPEPTATMAADETPPEAKTARLFEGHAEVVLKGAAAPSKDALAALKRAVVYVHAGPPKQVVGARIVAVSR